MFEGAIIPMIFIAGIGLVVMIAGLFVKRAMGQSDDRIQDLHNTIKDILNEARDTNHRIIKLEAWQIFERGQKKPKPLTQL